jgi:cobalamin biosynthesis protein CbiG
MKTLSVGIGCRLHSSADQIEAAVRAALGSLAFEQIRTIASIDTKADETGLLEFCARHALPLKFFSREQIAATAVTSPSAVVHEHLGVDGVCEPCALLAAAVQWDAAGMPAASAARAASASKAPSAPTKSTSFTGTHAHLIVRKTIRAGVAVAIASSTVVADHPPPAPDTHEREHEQDQP